MMPHMEEIQRMISTLRSQAQVLNAAADNLEHVIKPWVMMQDVIQTQSELMQSWWNLWHTPKT